MIDVGGFWKRQIGDIVVLQRTAELLWGNSVKSGKM